MKYLNTINHNNNCCSKSILYTLHEFLPNIIILKSYYFFFHNIFRHAAENVTFSFSSKKHGGTTFGCFLKSFGNGEYDVK